MKDRIRDIVTEMTLEEKVSMLAGVSSMNTAECERLGIPSIRFSDGPMGVRIEQGYEENCTSFPCLAAVGSTWNKELVEKIGEGIGNDCIKQGVDIILGPGANIKRTPLCGRNYEYFSEDPVLAGELAAAYINGVQKLGVGTCIKHFAANNQEIDRNVASSEVDERTLREIYLKVFEIACRKANPTAIMMSYNRLNGVKCAEDAFLMKKVLREDWDYQGMIVSDWYGARNPVLSLKYGMDLQMPKDDRVKSVIPEALENGEITEADIDRAVESIIKVALGKKRSEIKYDRDGQHQIAKQAEQEGIVLLKNEGDLLPITYPKCKKVLIIGEFAEKPVYYGYGSGRVYPHQNYIDTPLEHIIKELGDEIEVNYLPMYSSSLTSQRSVFSFVPDAKLFKEADVILMFVGNEFSVETEEGDRRSAFLDSYYDSYIRRTYNANKNIVLIMQTGSAVIPDSWHRKVPAIIQMWQAGEAGGSALAEIISGKVSPSGKLSETFAIRERKDIDYPGDGYKVCYDEKWAVGYRYYDLHTEDVWFPFGHGLSYTKFEYDNFKVCDSENELKLSFVVKNTGSKAGKEVVQIYASKEISFISRPKKWLVDFVKTKELQPGETQEIILRVDKTRLAYYSIGQKEWIIEDGEYTIQLGKSSQEICADVKYIHDEGRFSMCTDAYTIMG